MGQAEAFELDVGPARAAEQPDAVAEQNGRNAHEDLRDVVSQDRGLFSAIRARAVRPEDAVSQQGHAGESDQKAQLVSSEHSPSEADRHQEHSQDIAHPPIMVPPWTNGREARRGRWDLTENVGTYLHDE